MKIPPRSSGLAGWRRCHSPSARLNLLAADGTRLLATTWGDTLSALVTPEGTALASEPWDDDPRWTYVPDRSLVEVTPDGLTTTSLT